MNKPLKISLYVVGGLIILVVLAIVEGDKKIKSHVRQKESEESRAIVEKRVKEYKSQLPMRYDDKTLLYDYDVSYAEEAIVLTYKFDKPVNNETIRSMIFGDMRERLKEYYCKDKNFLESTNMGLKFRITYIDMNNEFITHYFLDYSDCQ